MNVIKKLMLGAAAMSLSAIPVAASAANASKLSLASHARAGKSVKGEKLAGGSGGIIVAILAAAAVVVGIVIVADNNNDSPNSP